MAYRALNSEDTRVLDNPNEKQTVSQRPNEDVVEHKPRTDKYIWGIYIAIIFFSLIELYSASSREVTAGHIFRPLFRHALLLGVGCVIMLGLQRVKYQVFYRLTWPIVFVCVILSVLVFFAGESINGDTRSISLGFFSLQSSELLKFSTVLVVARLLGIKRQVVNGKSRIPDRAVITVFGIVLLFSALLVNQGLTNTLLLICIAMSMMAISGVSGRQFWLSVLAFLVLGACYFAFSMLKNNISLNDKEKTEQVVAFNPHDDNRLAQAEPEKKLEKRDTKNNDQMAKNDDDRFITRLKRILNFLTGNKVKEKITSENQQEQFSYIAQANGGLFGVGFGNSRETARLPLAFSDYIFAIVVEDLGLIGGLFILSLYLLLLARAGAVGARLRKAFPTLLIIGMAVFIVFQALFHMAIVTGVFPVSGQPLPFISKGGSSIIISSVALGIMLSVSRYAARRKDVDLIEEDAAFADNPA